MKPEDRKYTQTHIEMEIRRQQQAMLASLAPELSDLQLQERLWRCAIVEDSEQEQELQHALEIYITSRNKLWDEFVGRVKSTLHID